MEIRNVFGSNSISCQGKLGLSYDLDNYGVVTFDHLHFSIDRIDDWSCNRLHACNFRHHESEDRSFLIRWTVQWKLKGFHVEFSQREESSSTSYSSTARVTGETFVTPYGSVYHSRRNCGKLKAAKTVGKFLPCMECGYDQPPTFFEDRLPQPVKRK